MATDNSIKSALNRKKDSVTSRVLQLLRSASLISKLIILVEGDDDKNFYLPFFNSDKVVVMPVSGCDKLRKAIASLNNVSDNKYRSRLAGIVDSDFFEIDGIPETERNIFRTDWHDHEAWLINKNGSILKICNIYGINANENPDILDSVYCGIENLSFIKWFHTRQKRAEELKEINNRKEGLDFGKSSMDVYFDASIKNSLNYLISTQINIAKKILISETDVNDFKKDNYNTDPKQLHVGHDVLNGLSYKIRQIKPQNIAKKEIYNHLTKEYQLSDFKSTSIYKKLQNYFYSIGCPNSLL